MRIYILIVSLFCSANLFSQNQGNIELQTKIEALELRNKVITKRLSQMEQENFNLKQQLEASNTNVQSQIARSQELQAQNERSMNLALDSFAIQFNEQNKSVQNVQEKLESGFMKQLLLFVAAVFVLTVLYLVMSKRAAKKALESYTATWNDFQEHMLKK